MILSPLSGLEGKESFGLDILAANRTMLKRDESACRLIIDDDTGE